MKDYSNTVQKIRSILEKYLIDNKLKSMTIGVSGGIDSALVCALAYPVAKKLGVELIGRSITIESNKPEEITRAKNIGENFCTNFKDINLTDEYLKLKKIDDAEGQSVDDIPYKIRMGNIKARMRMIYLYNLASKKSGIVLGTENKTEENLAFFTLHGDEASDVEPIKELWKTQIYEMSEYIASTLPTEERDAILDCVNCDATDGLGISNTDLDQILPDWKERHNNTKDGYKEVDQIFIDYFNKIESESYPSIVKHQYNEKLENSAVIQRYQRTHFKRHHPFIFKIV